MKKRLLIFTAALFFAIGLTGVSIFASDDPNNPGVVVSCHQQYEGKEYSQCWKNICPEEDGKPCTFTGFVVDWCYLPSL